MKYEKLILIYPFSIGSFLNAKVGIEATLEDGDDYMECYARLSTDVKRLAVKEQGMANAVSDGVNGSVSNGYGIPIPQEGFGNYKQEEPIGKIKIIDLNFTYDEVNTSIKYSESIKELEACETVIEKGKNLSTEEKRLLWLAYDEQFTKLSKSAV